MNTSLRPSTTQPQITIAYFRMHLVVLLSLVFSAPVLADAPTPGKPNWTVPNSIESDDGNGLLTWETGPDEAVEFFRLDEKFENKNTTGYVSGRSVNIFRATPGEYEFRLSGCVKDNQGLPKCGTASKKLSFVVTEAINDPYLEAADAGQAAASVAPLAAPAGGPSDLRPGHWINMQKDGHGWSFYWANRLALTSNPQNAYDLYGIWYTYEAQTKSITPICEPPDDPCGNEIEILDYRPVVATMQLVEVNSTTFGGTVYITRNGTAVNVGSATVTFGASDTSATIDWDVDFAHEALAAQESVSLHVGEDGSPFGDPTDLAGIWEPTSAASYLIVDDIGALSESVEVIFNDDDGDAVWIVASRGQAPQPGETDLCFFYVGQGYSPGDSSGALNPSYFEGSGCDYNTTASSTNRNGLRRFADSESGEYWVNFDLPPAYGQAASGSISIGSASFPAPFDKAANFHRIWSNDGTSCEVTAANPSCSIDLTWFTDGDYPNASVFRLNTGTQQRSLITTSTEPAMENVPVTLPGAGEYVFELRMTNNSASRLIAESLPFTVTLAPVASPTNLSASWINQSTGQYNVQWNHSDTTNVDYYELVETHPDSSTTTHTVSPGSTLNKTFSRPSGPFGTYSYRVRACSGGQCSSYTPSINWALSCTTSCPTQYPWADNAYGSLSTGTAWNYAMGYHFRPEVNGQITDLGGYFNGVKTVKLFERASGALLAQTTVSSSNNWSYSPITPVAVTAGTEYTVAVYLAGSGGSSRGGVNFPATYGNVTILGTTYASTSSDPNARPTNLITSTMYGQADIGFEAGGSPSQEPPVITTISDRSDPEGQTVSLQVVASDPDGTVVAFSDGGSLPPGLSINNSGLISGTVSASASGGSPYTVTITATDNDGLTDQDTFVWTVTAPPAGGRVDVFVDDFETDKGWTKNLQGADTATIGLWERADPGTSSYAGNIYQLGSTPSGSRCLVTDSRVGTGYTYDVDGGPTSISSPSITLPAGGTDYQLDFDYNFAFTSNTQSLDRFAVYVVTDSGETKVYEEIDTNSIQAGAWRAKQIDISSFAGQSVRIKFVADDDVAYGVLVEAQVDDVQVSYQPPAANTPPVVTNPGAQTTAEGTTITPLVIEVADAEDDPVTCTITGLPAGLTESSECTVSGTVTASAGDYGVAIVANDGTTDSDTVNFNWEITPLSGSINPETPPQPSGAPSMTPDAASSRVGATGGAFRVDETGNASYSIPIMTAPGSGGMAPQISLDYSSQGGNGALGVGWSLGGLSAITRCAQTLEQDGPGAVRGVTLTATDRFCLDGQRLILVSGSYGASGAEYRTEIDGISKVVSNGAAGTGPQSFTVWRKDGTTTEYGVTDDSRIEARIVGDLDTVMVWAQNRVTDSATNYIEYNYAETYGAAGEPVEFVLSSIEYTGNSTAGTSPYALIEFVYSSGRSDSTQSAIAGALVEQTQLLTQINSKSRVNIGTTLTSLRSYQLGYSASKDGHGRESLSSITECRDSSLSYCFEPTTFDWLYSQHQIGTNNITVGGVFDEEHAGMTLADVNGDGRPDMLLTEKNGSQFQFHTALALSSGGFASPVGSPIQIPDNGLPNFPVALHVIDLNADGFQDVIYPNGTNWKAHLSNGSTLDSAITVVSGCCDLTNPPLVRVMDFDGDGLSDLVTDRYVDGNTREIVFLKNTFTPSAPGTVGFDNPQLLSIDLEGLNLFPDTSSDGWLIDDEAPGFDNPNSTSSPFARPFDYNGDGAVDLLVNISQRYVQCGQGCSPSAPSSPGSSVLTQFNTDTSSEGEGAVPLQEETYANASFYLVLLSDGDSGFNAPMVVGKATDCYVDDPCGQFPTLPSAQKMLPVDVNSDGLADLAWQDGFDDWQVNLNTGAGFNATSITVASFDASDYWQSAQGSFLDVTGDGFPEFIYPDLFDDAAAKWHMVENLHGQAFSQTPVSTGAKYGKSSEFDAGIFVDVNADGMLDNLFLDKDSLGAIEEFTTKVYLGANSVGGQSSTNAINVISQVTNGFGAQTTLSYKPLTDSTVYTRMRDSKSADWGNGSVVYDLIAPIYVVSQAESSAPTYLDAAGTSLVQYHYVGAKLQAGGRGFLGFGEVISYDPQSGIRTNTRYRQDYPFNGLPADTTQAQSDPGQASDTISNPTGVSPVDWASQSVSATTQPPSIPSGTLLSYAVNQWTVIDTTAANTKFPYILNSLERAYTFSGAFKSKVLTTNTYSVYGDLVTADIGTYETDGNSALATQSSTNTYKSADTQNWRLGRLETSTVTHSRGAAFVTRKSSFDYDNATGILDQEVIEPDNDAFQVTTDYYLDDFGNRSEMDVSASGVFSRATINNYDSLGRFVVESRNAINQITHKVISWDVFGNSLVVENIDGVRTTSAADYMGRPFISYTETGAWTKTIQSNTGLSYCPASHTAFREQMTGGGQPEQFRCYDALGREIRTATRGFDGGLIYVDRYYDESGRLSQVTEPYFSGGTIYWNYTSYDDLGRVILVTAADGNNIRYDYDDDENATACGVSDGANQVLITNGLGQKQFEVRNVLGEAVSVYDNACGEISYDYDAVGNLVSVIGVDGAETTTSYDLAGRKTQMTDPDKGTWQYAYNPLGELTRQLDSNNQAIEFSYDYLGRVTYRREYSGTSSLTLGNGTLENYEVTFWNNGLSGTGLGQVTLQAYVDGDSNTLQSKEFEYDEFGRVSRVTNEMDGVSLDELTTYDEFGRVFQQFDASSGDYDTDYQYNGVRYHYNNSGYTYRLREARQGSNGLVYQDIQSMDERGNITYMVMGNGVEVFATYHPNSGRVYQLEAYDAQGAELQFVTYSFDVAGNLLGRHDTSGTDNLNETFGYDLLNRLEEVLLSTDGGAAQTTLSLQYDPNGNITYKSDVGNYLYGQSGAGPHAVTDAGGVTYNYDNNGNQISSSDGRSITYTVFDQAALIQKGADSTEFSYGLGNKRIKREDNNSIDEVKTTWYFGGVERIQEGSNNPYFKRTISAFVLADYYPTTQAQDNYYLVKDHLGSIHTVTSSENSWLTEPFAMHFGAFGERQSYGWNAPLSPIFSKVSNLITTKGFTGHEHADGLGIVHMNGRIYDPRLGRMLQADPFVQNPKNSQSLNRYSYVLNNPLSYTDPSGYFSIGKFFKKYWRVIVAAVVSYYTFGIASSWA